MDKTNLYINVAPSDLSYAEAITRFQVDMAMQSEGLACLNVIILCTKQN